MRATHTTRRGVTFADLLIAVVVMLVIATIAMSTMAPNDRSRLLAAAGRVASDLENARAISISTADDNAVVRFDPEGEGYWVAFASDTETPMAANGLGEPYRIEFGLGDAEVLVGVAISLVSAGEDGGMVRYDSFGRLAPVQAAEVVVANVAGTVSILVDPFTGDVSMGPIVDPE